MTFGDIGCFSLQINKIITTGDGGALITDNPKYLKHLVSDVITLDEDGEIDIGDMI